ncbi:hypothetical protein B0T14DRAFT_443706, partial [Immersiella caudata]
MELIGIIRCPLKSLIPFGKGRHLNPKHVERLAKRLQRSCRPNEQRNHIRGIVTSAELERILKTLGLSREELQGTTRGLVVYPHLSNHQIACLDGAHRLAAAALCKKKPESWTVQLYYVHGSWIEFPHKITSPTTTSKQIHYEAEYFSHEAPKGDGEIFVAIWKSRLEKDTDRENEHWERLSNAKQATLRGFLEGTPELAEALYQVSQFPGVIS